MGTIEVIARPAARAIILDRRKRILLGGWALQAGRVWMTPGGGLDPGESHEQALERELREEIGLRGVRLGPWVWKREDHFSFAGRRYHQMERFYLVRVGRVEPDCGGLVGQEAEVLLEHRWWTVTDIERSAEVFAPNRLAAFLKPILDGHIPTQPIDVGR